MALLNYYWSHYSKSKKKLLIRERGRDIKRSNRSWNACTRGVPGYIAEETGGHVCA